MPSTPIPPRLRPKALNPAGLDNRGHPFGSSYRVRSFFSMRKRAPEGTYLRFFAASRISFKLVSPVSFRMVFTVAFGENWGIGFDRFLLMVSLLFKSMRPVLGGAWSRCRPSSPGSFIRFPFKEVVKIIL